MEEIECPSCGRKGKVTDLHNEAGTRTVAIDLDPNCDGCLEAIRGAGYDVGYGVPIRDEHGIRASKFD